MPDSVTWLRPTPAEALAELELQVVRPWSQRPGYTCLCCGASDIDLHRVPYTQACPVRVLQDATRTGDSIYTHTDAEVRGMVLDAIRSRVGVVPDSCAEVYAAAREATAPRIDVPAPYPLGSQVSWREGLSARPRTGTVEAMHQQPGWPAEYDVRPLKRDGAPCATLQRRTTPNSKRKETDPCPPKLPERWTSATPVT